MIFKKTSPYAVEPKRANPTDAGLDMWSAETQTIYPGETAMVDTGISVKIPVGYCGLLFNRSSQGKLGISIPNSVGVIDSDYRGPIKVLLTNNGKIPYDIKCGITRVAQLVVVPILIINMVEFEGSEEEWNDTKRGTGGFGSTGGV